MALLRKTYAIFKDLDVGAGGSAKQEKLIVIKPPHGYKWRIKRIDLYIFSRVEDAAQPDPGVGFRTYFELSFRDKMQLDPDTMEQQKQVEAQDILIAIAGQTVMPARDSSAGGLTVGRGLNHWIEWTPPEGELELNYLQELNVHVGTRNPSGNANAIHWGISITLHYEEERVV